MGFQNNNNEMVLQNNNNEMVLQNNNTKNRYYMINYDLIKSIENLINTIPNFINTLLKNNIYLIIYSYDKIDENIVSLIDYYGGFFIDFKKDDIEKMIQEYIIHKEELGHTITKDDIIVFTNNKDDRIKEVLKNVVPMDVMNNLSIQSLISKEKQNMDARKFDPIIKKIKDQIKPKNNINV